MKLSEQIKAIRKAQGLSVEQLAEKCEVKAFTVYRWEDGTIIPRLQTIERIATALNCQVSILLEPITPRPAKKK
jgi:putative transcriptional regulator